MKEQLKLLRESSLNAIAEAQTGEELEALRIKYLGKKGELTAVLKQMGKLSAEERPVIGQLANEVRASIEEAITEQAEKHAAAALEKKLKEEKIDVTMPGTAPALGQRHPLAIVQREMEEIFIGMGFSIAEGPEVEYDYYNFQALNIPENHPARDTQDTFYITENILLRSQTSPVHLAATSPLIGPWMMLSRLPESGAYCSPPCRTCTRGLRRISLAYRLKRIGRCVTCSRKPHR